MIQSTILNIMKTGSLLAPKIVEKTVRMTETGLMEKLYRQHLPKPVNQDEEEQLEKLELHSIGLGFIVWGTGVFVALIVCIAGEITKRNRLMFTV